MTAGAQGAGDWCVDTAELELGKMFSSGRRRGPKSRKIERKLAPDGASGLGGWIGVRVCTVSEYVLGKSYPEMGGTLFVCGNHPKMVMFHPDIEYAAKFASPEEAVAFRSLMDHQLGGTHKYHVHEFAGGRLRDLEA
jgi:hypothetical protein